jgi:2-polyprenyl-3-methyl-5-hydroxy-6-metoxy-1,4-benzoquinol methylase
MGCGACGLVFVPGREHLSPEEERARYLNHRNGPEDEGYRAFLSRLTRELAPRLSPGARGLDYGSGPGPALGAMMGEMGFSVRNFDPYFEPVQGVLEDVYDFITCTETAEHFREPGEEFKRLAGLLRPGGWLGVMTRMPAPGEELKGWWYLRDVTHITIYRREAMLWIARRFGMSAEFPSEGVVLFRKG